MSGMSKSKTNRHERKLIPSTLDDVMLSAMVEERFISLCELYRRVHATQLMPPVDMKSDLLLWREMRMRHNCKACGSAQLHSTPEGQIIVDQDQQPGCHKCQSMGIDGRGDYRHRVAEMKAAKNVAQWTLKLNARLRNQPEPVVDLGE